MSSNLNHALQFEHAWQPEVFNKHTALADSTQALNDNGDTTKSRFSLYKAGPVSIKFLPCAVKANAPITV